MILGIGHTMYYSFQKDDITTLDWNGTTYLQEDEWGNIIADNNIFNVDITVNNKEGNLGSIVVMIIDEKGNKIEDEITVDVGTTVTFSNLPWNSGTYVVMAKASVSGSHEFHVTSESK